MKYRYHADRWQIASGTVEAPDPQTAHALVLTTADAELWGDTEVRVTVEASGDDQDGAH